MVSLATLYGEPGDELAAKNRETWNRWMAPRLSGALKTALREKGWSDKELTPFSQDEQQSIGVDVGSPLNLTGLISPTPGLRRLLRQKGRLPIAIYGGLSDYGRSYFRPLVLIAAVLLVGAFLLAYQLVGFRAPMPGRAFAAFANTFSVLGIRREFADPNTIKVFLR